MGFLEEMQEIEYLGGEFATWLLVETALGRGPGDWGECRECTVAVAGPIVLEGPGQGASQVALRGDDLLQSPELRAALAEGKHVRKVRLEVASEEDQWRGALDAKTLEWRSVGLEVPKLPDAGEYAFMRAQAFERLVRLLDEWFAAFLRRRMSPKKWEAALDGIRTFATTRPTPK